MYLNVKDRGDHVATFRWTEVRLMEMLSAWVPTTPELEVKLVFGAHIWECAQHADALGKRTHELRLPLHDSLEPARGYADLLAEVARITDTSKRIAAFYEVLLPGLAQRFRNYLDRVDTLLDGPTVRILERIMADMTRMESECRKLLDEVPAVKLADRKWLEDLRKREGALGGIVGTRPASPAAVPVG
jgi:hypothetical protein